MKKICKKLMVVMMVLTLVFSMTACGGGDQGSGGNSKEDNKAAADDNGAPADNGGDSKDDGGEAADNSKGDGKKVGIAMPSKDLQRWSEDGAYMKEAMENNGYTVDIQYANNDIGVQASQIENMITGGCDILVIAAIDGGALSEVLEKAKAADIPVIAYDRLIMNTDAVSYYATFDNEKIGIMQGQYIADKLDLENQAGPFNFEIFTGPTDDNNVNFYFGGAMSVLQKYVDEGKLVIQSGTEVSMAACATPNWSQEEAQKRMDNIIAKSYTGGEKLDAVLSSNDSVANGITNALLTAGYTEEDFPIITGQDCEITSVKNMLKGLQSMSVFVDTRRLANVTADMVDAIMNGEEPEINNTTDYDNGTGIIPTYLCEPQVCDIDNYKEVLIDSGYYTEDRLQ